MSRSGVLALLSCALLVPTVPLASAATKESSVVNTGAVSAVKEPIAILELRGSKELKFTAVTTPDLAISLTIENQTTSVLKNVELKATDLHSPAGDVATPEFDPKTTFEIDVGVPKTVKLKLRLLNAGTYTGTVTISQRTTPKNKESQSLAPNTLLRFSIEVARTTSAPSIAISDIAAQERVFFPYPWRDPLNVPLKMTIYATGAEVKVSRPFLDDVTLKPKADSASGSHVSQVQFDLEKVPDPITVMPGKPTTLELGIKGIASPGRYDGSIRFAPAGFQPTSKSFTIYVRDSYWVALAFIAIGVAISFGVLYYTRMLRPRLLAQERMTTMLLMLRAESVRATGDADAETLVRKVRTNVNKRWDDTRRMRRAITTELDVFEQIVQALGSWIQLHKQVREIRPDDVRYKLMKFLDDAEIEFANPSPDSAKVQSAISSVGTLPQKIRTEIREKLTSQINTLRAMLLQYPLHDITAQLENASEELAHDNIEEAIKIAESARLSYAIILAEELLKRVADSITAPEGMEPVQWDALKRATTRAATIVSATENPDIAAMRLFAAGQPYIIAVSNAIEKSAKESITDGAVLKSITDAAESARMAVSNSVADGLNKLDAAARLYEKAIARPGQTMGEILPSLAAAALGAAPGGPSFDVIGAFGYGPPASDLDQPIAAKATARRIELSDKFVSAIIVAVACLVGLQVLWVDNMVWGGWTNYIAAFVWGFAVNQFSHAGVAALRK